MVLILAWWVVQELTLGAKDSELESMLGLWWAVVSMEVVEGLLVLVLSRLAVAVAEVEVEAAAEVEEVEEYAL